MKRSVLVRRTSLGRCKPGDKPKARAKKSTNSKPKRGAPTTKTLDTLWSLVVRQRAIQECQMYGCGNRLCGGCLQAHHIFGRGMSVRWNLDNGLALCGSHHLHYVHNGNNQAAAQEDIREIVGPELYEELRALHNKEGKNCASYRREVYAFISEELARLKAA